MGQSAPGSPLRPRGGRPTAARPRPAGRQRGGPPGRLLVPAQPARLRPGEVGAPLRTRPGRRGHGLGGSASGPAGRGGKRGATAIGHRGERSERSEITPMVLWPVAVLLDRVLPMPTPTEPRRWQVFFYDLDRVWPDFSDPLAQCFAGLSQWARSHGAVTGQPFLLGPNGRPDSRVNAFFGAPRTRALDTDTWRKYGYALGMWLNFLESRGKSGIRRRRRTSRRSRSGGWPTTATPPGSGRARSPPATSPRSAPSTAGQRTPTESRARSSAVRCRSVAATDSKGSRSWQSARRGFAARM